MGLAGPFSGASLFAEEKKPNILFILTDDHRYDAFRCMGNSDTKCCLPMLWRDPRGRIADKALPVRQSGRVPDAGMQGKRGAAIKRGGHSHQSVSGTCAGLV